MSASRRTHIALLRVVRRIVHVHESSYLGRLWFVVVTGRVLASIEVLEGLGADCQLFYPLQVDLYDMTGRPLIHPT